MRQARPDAAPLTISKRLLLLNGVVLVMTTAIGLFGRSHITDDTALLTRAQSTLRASVEVDMMHDAIRADVLAARLATDDAGRKAATADLDEHATRITELLGSLADSTKDDAEVSATVAGARAEVDSYVAAARASIAAIGTPGAAAADSAFGAKFSKLETLLAEESDAVVASDEAIVKGRHDAAASGRAVVLVLTVVAALATSVLIAIISRGIARKLKDLGARLGESATRITHAGVEMSGIAETTVAEAATSTSTANGVSSDVGAIAAATDQLTCSIVEISSNATSATHVALDAVRVVDETNENMARLSRSSQEIGQVLDVISSIAEQTNLLALNATIEAARAGDAGRGFAVVANEVKELAKQTASATQDISGRINAIQYDSDVALASIAQISDIIGQIAEMQTTIASAVEEQTATTSEISRSINHAAEGASAIATSVEQVVGAASNTADAVHTTQAAAEDIRDIAGDLAALVGA